MNHNLKVSTCPSTSEAWSPSFQAYPQRISRYPGPVTMGKKDRNDAYGVNVLSSFKAEDVPTESNAGTTAPSMKAESDFLADMSHEIRTPISAIIGLATVLLASPINARQRECLQVLHGSAEALMQMIGNVLDSERLQAKGAILEHAPFNLPALLAQVVGLMAIKAQQKNIALVLQAEGGLPDIVMGDSGHIRRILINLVGNAIKFTESGEVSVAFGASGADRKQLAISVTDTGIGIAENKLSAVFERFTQADSTIAGRFGGSGLGLAISKTLAENMGGSLSVTSTAGMGSTFVLQLPLIEQQPLPPRPLGDMLHNLPDLSRIAALHASIHGTSEEKVMGFIRTLPALQPPNVP